LEKSHLKIDRISLQLSNCYLLTGRRSVLVDCGCQSDWTFLEKSLSQRGVEIGSLAAVILTHVHFDHCGCAAFLQAEGVPVIASVSAEASLSQGIQEGKSWLEHGSRLPVFGRLLSTHTRFQPVNVDFPVSSQLELSDFGIDGQVVLSGGHTQGSVSVVLDNRKACIGDLIMGGFLGLPPAWKPQFHPLNTNNQEALAQIISLRDAGVDQFFVGHGDTLMARDIDHWIEGQIRLSKQ
jgi:hydroxyacylglutathione hydrolase